MVFDYVWAFEASIVLLLPLVSVFSAIAYFMNREDKTALKDAFAQRKVEIVYRVAYRSKLTKACSVHDLMDQTRQFRKFNNLRGITGVMYLNVVQEEIFQIIEGPHDEVLDLLERIFADTRHTVDRDRIVRKPFVPRTYAHWNMACHNFPIVDSMSSSLLWGCLMARTKMTVQSANWDNTAIPPLTDIAWITTQKICRKPEDLPFRTSPIQVSRLHIDRIAKRVTFTIKRKPDGSMSNMLLDMLKSRAVTISFLPEFASKHFQKFISSRFPEVMLKERKPGTCCLGGRTYNPWFEKKLFQEKLTDICFSESGFHFTPINYANKTFCGVFPAAKSLFTAVQGCRQVYSSSAAKWCGSKVKEDIVMLPIKAIGIDDHIRYVA